MLSHGEGELGFFMKGEAMTKVSKISLGITSGIVIFCAGVYGCWTFERWKIQRQVWQEVSVFAEKYFAEHPDDFTRDQQEDLVNALYIQVVCERGGASKADCKANGPLLKHVGFRLPASMQDGGE